MRVIPADTHGMFLTKASNVKAKAKVKVKGSHRCKTKAKTKAETTTARATRRTKPKSVHSQKLYNAKRRVHIKQQHLYTRRN